VTKHKSISCNAITIIFLQPNIQRVTKFFLLLIVSFFLTAELTAQAVADSDTLKKDTPIVVFKKPQAPKDSFAKKDIPKKDTSASLKKKDSLIKASVDTILLLKKKPSIFPSEMVLFRNTLLQNKYYNFYGKINVQEMQTHRYSSTDGLFYLLVGLCFYFALIRLFFWKYLNNLFALFFRASMRQPQMREQALQTPLPSLLLNILFILSSGLYACFFVRYYHFAHEIEFWVLYIYCILAMVVIYVTKYSVLKICGWIFNITKAADNYIFIVFLVNKILGIVLLPFVILIAFSGPVTIDISITISLVMIIVLFIYRFIACFGTVRSQIKLNMFHYFLYLCAFEIAPLLLIYKIVLSFFDKAY